MTHICKVLILGSGGLRIGQAGEFDYSGSQAIKALKEEGIETILVNPNIATVQTDADMADKVYLEPLNLERTSKIIEKERPDAILLSVGGQTALNLGLALEKHGILARYDVKVLGTPTSAIRITEDRELFKQALAEIQVHTARSIQVEKVEDALTAAQEIGYPVMIRSGFSLGGLGSGKIHTPQELRQRASEALNQAPHLLIEEYLQGWKEIEYEIVRDCDGNTLTVCNMENFDPMGVHTGESIVVAPSQTLTNSEFHLLREVALRTATHLGIVGECNIQYALHPHTSEYRVIEVNARLSRSSALASKATGYPLAFVAAKLALGKRLHEIPNNVTKQTTAFFEPALDYLVVKMPRWDIQKFKSADRSIGSEMKSVGEVMAIGRSFPEALQKAVRMVNRGASGLTDYPYEINNLKDEIAHPTDRRLFAIARFFSEGGSVEEVQKLSHIDPWFLHHLKAIVEKEMSLKAHFPWTPHAILEAKKLGFSDQRLAKISHQNEELFRQKRISLGIKPWIKQIDTLAGEFSAETNYLYATYHGSCHDLTPSFQSILVLGSGPYCIGSSVEFDWCAVNTVKRMRSHGRSVIVMNSNPETVSTDYDESDRLYFEEMSFERVQDIADFEEVAGIVVSVGGQIANNLALPLEKAGYPLLGTSASSIDMAEDRQKFSSLLNTLDIDQPAWEKVSTLEKARAFAQRVGYPVLVRPSYVLSGAAMNTVYSDQELEQFLAEAALVSADHPVVISQFISHSKELEIDGVAQEGRIVIEAISEHIENAGIHSGDATIVLPPQRLYLETIRRAKLIARNIAEALCITGPFNMQFIATDNRLKVIECNLRASRSFPFVSKVTNHNFIAIAADVLLGIKTDTTSTLELDHVGVKTAQFSYSRLKGANPVAHVEMASTGEVACLGRNLEEAFYLSWLATEQQVHGKRLLVSIGGNKKEKLLPWIKKLDEQGWEIYATENTHDYLCRQGIGANFLYKASQEKEPNIVSAISQKQIDLIVNIPRSQGSRSQITDGFKIRRLAIDNHIPLITNLHLALMLLQCLSEIDVGDIPVKSWQEFTTSYQTNPSSFLVQKL